MNNVSASIKYYCAITVGNISVNTWGSNTKCFLLGWNAFSGTHSSWGCSKNNLFWPHDQRSFGRTLKGRHEERYSFLSRRSLGWEGEDECLERRLYFSLNDKFWSFMTEDIFFLVYYFCKTSISRNDLGNAQSTFKCCPHLSNPFCYASFFQPLVQIWARLTECLWW